MSDKKYVVVEAEWLADQFPRYTNDPMEYILGFPEVNLLTPGMEMAEGIVELLTKYVSKISEFEEEEGRSVYGKTWKTLQLEQQSLFEELQETLLTLSTLTKGDQ